MGHLTQNEMIGYRRRKLSAAAMLIADDHIARCEPCRRLLAACEPMVDTSGVLAQLGEPHLAYETIEEYVDERAAGQTRRRVESHLEFCQTCREEVEDLQAFRNRSKTWTTPGTKRRPFQWFLGNPAWAAAFAALLVVAAAAWWWNSARPKHTAPMLALNDGPAAGAPATDRAAMERALLHGSLEIPEAIAALRGTRTVVRAPGAGDDFELISPAATAVLSDRPEFTWKPLAAAAGYRVAIFVAGFHKAAESPWIESTAWMPAEPLERGRVYTWQVTARLGAGADAPTVRAPALQDPEARFEVLDAPGAAALERSAREHPSSHLLLGTLYARAGVLDLAEREFAALAAANPQSPQAAALLEKIRVARR